MTRLFSSSPGAIWNFIVNNLYGCRIATGQYTGDGTLGQSITGLGFRPRVLWIMERKVAEDVNTTYSFLKTDQFAPDMAHYVGGNQTLDNRVNTLDVDGFTVDDDGANQPPNALGITYMYWAIG